jgi:hypothetical protein
MLSLCATTLLRMRMTPSMTRLPEWLWRFVAA